MASASSSASSSPLRPAAAVPVPVPADSRGEAASHYEELASLLQKDDAQLGPAIKVVFDRQLQQTYEEGLSKFVRKKKAEIKSICNAHYEEFIGSIDNLITVKKDIAQLRSLIVQLNEDVQDSGQEVLNHVEELVQFQTIKENLTSAIDVVERCLFVSGLLNKAAEQTESKKYFSALKTLDQVRRHHLATFSSAEISSFFEQQIPEMLLTIKNKVKAEFEDWLRDVQPRSEKLGALAMVQVEKQLHAEAHKEDTRRRRRMKNRFQSEAKDAEIFVNTEDDASNGEELFETVQIDLAPVHQAMHVYENIGFSEKFAQLYQEKRQTQASNIVDSSNMRRDDFLEAVPQYFAPIAGFFMVEDSVLKSGANLMSRTDVELLWEMALSKVKVVLLEKISSIDQVDHLLQLKNQVVLFAKTMESYGFDAGPLLGFIASHRDKYEELLNARLGLEMDKIFEQEKFEPLTIENRHDYHKFVVSFGLHEYTDLSEMHADPESIEFPIGMPFSTTVPLVCRAVKHFIGDFFKFASHLPDMNSHIRKALDELLCTTVDSALNRMLDNGPSLNVSQAVQVSLNANFLIHACDFWEKYTLVFADPRYQHPMSLNARSRFAHTRVRGEDAIFEIIDVKVDSIMYGLSGNIDWTPMSPQDMISEYILMLSTYLETALTCVEHMPKAVRLAVHFTSCKHIAKILLSFLRDAPRFNMIGIYNLDMDVQHLEDYARRCNIHNLVESFAELRQIIDLFMSGNLEQVLDTSTRETRFSLLTTEKLLHLFGKFKELGLLAATPSEIPRIKRKHVDQVARQLRASGF